MTRTVALLLSFLLGATVPARADDFGPASEIQAVRYDAQRLLAHTLSSYKIPPSAVTLSDTVVVSDWALSSWRAQSENGIIILRKQRGQWWDMLEGVKDTGWRFDGAKPLTTHWDLHYAGPAPQLLLEMGVPPTLVAEAKAHNSDVQKAQGNAIWHGDPYCSDFCENISPTGGEVQSVNRDAGAGYFLSVRFSGNTAESGTKIKRVYGRMPTDGESTQTLHGDAFYFFTIELSGSKPVTFKPGTTIDVWFPHLLDTYRHYGLTGAMSNSAFGPVRATLADNTLHFVLPAFTVAPNDPIMFEIDGDV